MHLSTEEPAASRMLEPFGEVGGDVPEYFSSRTHFAKIEDKKSYCEKLGLKTYQLEFRLLITQTKCMLRVLKRTVSMRRFF